MKYKKGTYKWNEQQAFRKGRNTGLIMGLIGVWILGVGVILQI